MRSWKYKVGQRVYYGITNEFVMIERHVNGDDKLEKLYEVKAESDGEVFVEDEHWLHVSPELLNDPE